jgi:tRNA dimethylallyltransferase
LPAFAIISNLDKRVTQTNPGIVILGPTASGKTHLAILLAGRFQGEIVSCDALQIYSHMDIGTAKILPHERMGIPHHMLDLREPGQDFSAGDYQRLAREALRRIRERGNLPFVVGGTGFYLRALIDGLFEGPARSQELRNRMRQIIRRKGPKILHRSLRRVDPKSAERIAETDGERIIRAYEVYLATGKPISWWQQKPRDSLEGYRWLKIGIRVPREQLYRRIDQRAEEMFRSGFLEEVQQLMRGFPTECHAFKAIGYRQAIDYFDGKLTLEQTIEETKKQSRHYAKRQLTWFRSDPDITWLEAEPDLEALQTKAADLIGDFLKK